MLQKDSHKISSGGFSSESDKSDLSKSENVSPKDDALAHSCPDTIEQDETSKHDAESSGNQNKESDDNKQIDTSLEKMTISHPNQSRSVPRPLLKRGMGPLSPKEPPRSPLSPRYLKMFAKGAPVDGDVSFVK